MRSGRCPSLMYELFWTDDAMKEISDADVNEPSEIFQFRRKTTDDEILSIISGEAYTKRDWHKAVINLDRTVASHDVRTRYRERKDTWVEHHKTTWKVRGRNEKWSSKNSTTLLFKTIDDDSRRIRARSVRKPMTHDWVDVVTFCTTRWNV